MEYTIIVNEQSYDLPPKKLAVAKELDAVLKVDTVKGLSVEQKFEKLHAFMKNLVGEEAAKEMFGSDSLEEIDLAELTLAVKKVVDAYDKPITDYEADKSRKEFDKIPIDKLLSISKAAEKIAFVPQKK